MYLSLRAVYARARAGSARAEKRRLCTSSASARAGINKLNRAASTFPQPHREADARYYGRTFCACNADAPPPPPPLQQLRIPRARTSCTCRARNFYSLFSFNQKPDPDWPQSGLVARRPPSPPAHSFSLSDGPFFRSPTCARRDSNRAGEMRTRIPSDTKANPVAVEK